MPTIFCRPCLDIDRTTYRQWIAYRATKMRSDSWSCGPGAIGTVTRPHLPFSVPPARLPACSISALAGDHNFKPATVHFTRLERRFKIDSCQQKIGN